jgi:peptidoglycan/LPS O-acetylase OafA/YrhL
LLAPAWSISLEWQYYLLAPFLAWFACRPVGLAILGIISCGNVVYSHLWSAAFLPERLPLFLIGIGSYHFYANSEKWKHSPYRLHILAASFAAILIVGWHPLALLIWICVFSGVLANESDPAGHFFLAIRSLLLKRPLQFVGAISYPLYLVHWPVIVGAIALLATWLPGISSDKALAIMLVMVLPAILVAAWLLHILIEKPLMQFGKKFTR